MAGRGRSDADEALALALAGGQTIRDAAEKVGVAERTVYWRLENPEFRARVLELRSVVVQRAAGLLADGLAGAVARLRQLVSSPDERVALAACREMLDQAGKLGAADLQQYLAIRETLASIRQRRRSDSMENLSPDEAIARLLSGPPVDEDDEDEDERGRS
jgi:hypothetical protein